MDDIIKIVKSVEELDILIKSVSETIENVTKVWNGRFLVKILGTLGAEILGNY